MYTPREDSFLIAKHIKEYISNIKPNSKVLDMCTGSAILAREAVKYAASVTACDINKKLISKLKKSMIFGMHGNSKRISCTGKQKVFLVPKTENCFQALKKENKNKENKKIKFIHSNLFSNIKDKDRFDLIIFNPPYLPSKQIKDIEIDGGKNGTEIIERFLRKAKDHLNPEGKILLICSSLNKNIEQLFKRYKYQHQLIDEKAFFFEKLFLYDLSIID